MAVVELELVGKLFHLLPIRDELARGNGARIRSRTCWKTDFGAAVYGPVENMRWAVGARTQFCLSCLVSLPFVACIYLFMLFFFLSLLFPVPILQYYYYYYFYYYYYYFYYFSFFSVAHEREKNIGIRLSFTFSMRRKSNEEGT